MNEYLNHKISCITKILERYRFLFLYIISYLYLDELHKCLFHNYLTKQLFTTIRIFQG